MKKNKPLDPHTERAAKHFKVHPNNVTNEQRAIGKRLNYLESYNKIGYKKNLSINEQIMKNFRTGNHKPIKR